MAKRKISGYVTFDIETQPDKQWHTALLGDCCYVSKCDQHGVQGYIESDLTAWFLNNIFVPEYANHIIYAHNGMRFDYKHLDLKRLADLGFNGRILSDKQNNYKSIEVHNPDDTMIWYLQDSMLKFNNSLRKMLQTFAPELPKGDINFEKENFDTSNPEHVAYALRDSEGLYLAIARIDEMFQRQFDISFHDAPTAPGLSLKAFKTFCKARHLEMETIDDENEKIFRESYYGAQTLAFDINWHEDVIALDIHSSYGAAMLNNPMPTGHCTPYKPFKGQLLMDNELYDCDVFIPRDVFPAIKSRIERNGKAIKGNNGGHITGKWWGFELKLQLQFGGTITAIHKAWSFSNETPILQQFIAKLKGMRKEKKSPMDALGKLLQNSLYGKFAQERIDKKTCFGYDRPEGSDYDCDPDTREWQEWIWTADEPRKPYQNNSPVHWGSYITALARHKLNTAILIDPAVVLYCDTDSIFFERKHLPKFQHLIGEDYGTWGIEDDKSGRFKAYAPKAYFTAGKRINKGIPRNRFEQIRKAYIEKHPNASQYEIDNYCANILSVDFIQMRGIHHVQQTGKRGGRSSRKTAIPEKIGFGIFNAQGRWEPDYAEAPENSGSGEAVKQ